MKYILNKVRVIVMLILCAQLTPACLLPLLDREVNAEVEEEASVLEKPWTVEVEIADLLNESSLASGFIEQSCEKVGLYRVTTSTKREPKRYRLEGGSGTYSAASVELLFWFMFPISGLYTLFDGEDGSGFSPAAWRTLSKTRPQRARYGDGEPLLARRSPRARLSWSLQAKGGEYVLASDEVFSDDDGAWLIDFSDYKDEIRSKIHRVKRDGLELEVSAVEITLDSSAYGETVLSGTASWPGSKSGSKSSPTYKSVVVKILPTALLKNL